MMAAAASTMPGLPPKSVHTTIPASDHGTVGQGGQWRRRMVGGGGGGGGGGGSEREGRRLTSTVCGYCVVSENFEHSLVPLAVLDIMHVYACMWGARYPLCEELFSVRQDLHDCKTVVITAWSSNLSARDTMLLLL